MDPLGALLEALLGYFDPSYLAFTLVMGYLWFFLFFFGTGHWNRLEWAERFFFGFLIGLFSMIGFAIITGPLILLLVFIYAEHLVPLIIYLVPTLFSVFLLLFRASLDAPLSSGKAKDYLLWFLTNHRSYWPYLLIGFSLITYFGLGWDNPFFNEACRSFWLGFIIIVDFSAFVFFIFMAWFVTQLSCLTFKHSLKQLVGLVVMVFNFCFLSVWKRDTDVYWREELKRRRHSRIALFFKAVISFMRNDFFHKVILTVVLALVIVLADSSFHLFSPAVELVETDYESVEIEVFKYFRAPPVYTIEVVKKYWINLPRFPIRCLNLSIPNPSNFSIYDGSKYLTWEKRPYAMFIEADSSLSYTVITNSEREIESINVMPINVSQRSYRSFFELTYRDCLNLELIKVSGPEEEPLGNGSMLVTMSLIINNTESRRLSSDEFALFEVAYYGNLTSFELFENGTKAPSQWNFIRDQWLWISFRVNEHSFSNLTISAVFEEMAT